MPNKWSYQPGAEDKARRLANRVLEKFFPVSGTLKCPSCDSPNNTHSGDVPGSSPSEGDFSICFYCGELQVFTYVRDRDEHGYATKRLMLRKPTSVEEIKASRSPSVREARRLIAEHTNPTEAVMKRWGLL